MKSYLPNIISFWSNRKRYHPHRKQYLQIIIHIALTGINITVIINDISLSVINSLAKNSNYGHHKSAIMFSNLIFGFP